MSSSSHPLSTRLNCRQEILEGFTKDLFKLVSPDEDSQLKRIVADLLNADLLTLNAEKLQGIVGTWISDQFPKIFSATPVSPQMDGLDVLMHVLDLLFDADHYFVLSELKKCPGIEEEFAVKLRTRRERQLDREGRVLVRTLILFYGILISELDHTTTEEECNNFLEFIKGFKEDIMSVQLMIEGLKKFLRVDFCRNAFADDEELGVSWLIDQIEGAGKLGHSDTLYHILFCIWQMTYTAKGLAVLSETKFVSRLAVLMKTIPPEREEIVRVITFIIGQLIPSAPFIEQALDAGIARLLRIFRGKKYVDQTLNATVVDVCDQLEASLRHVSLWDKYLREVKNKTLKISSAMNETFWKLHIDKFSQGNDVLLSLADLLDCEDPVVVAAACRDLGEYAKRADGGKQRLSDLHIKEKIMGLLAHPDQEVRRWALRTCQLLLLSDESS